MEHILQPPYHTIPYHSGAYPSTHSISPHFLLPSPSSHCLFNQVHSLSSSSSSFCLSSIFCSGSRVGRMQTDSSSLYGVAFFPVSTIHHRSNLSNKSFTSQISTAGEDQQPGKMLRPRNLLHIHQILRYKVEKPLVQFKAL